MKGGIDNSLDNDIEEEVTEQGKAERNEFIDNVTLDTGNLQCSGVNKIIEACDKQRVRETASDG